MKLGVDEFFDYRNQDYSELLHDVDYVMILLEIGNWKKNLKY